MADEVRRDKRKVAILTVNSNVVVPVVAVFNKIKPAELWIVYFEQDRVCNVFCLCLIPDHISAT